VFTEVVQSYAHTWLGFVTLGPLHCA